MSIEGMWYASYDEQGNRPKLNRLIRMAPVDQLGLAFDFACDFYLYGDAGWMHRTIETTGERYWWWPKAPRGVKYGVWWLLPKRTTQLAERAHDWAATPQSIDDYSSFAERLHVRLHRLRRRSAKARASSIARAAWHARSRIVFLALLLHFPHFIDAGLALDWEIEVVPPFARPKYRSDGRLKLLGDIAPQPDDDVRARSPYLFDGRATRKRRRAHWQYGRLALHERPIRSARLEIISEWGPRGKPQTREQWERFGGVDLGA